MNRLFLLVQILVISLGLNAWAQAKTSQIRNKSPKPAMTKKGTPSHKQSQLGTSFSFDTASVRGKYQTAGQGIAIVEDEKVLEDLLGLRRSFKDRELQEISRR